LISCLLKNKRRRVFEGRKRCNLPWRKKKRTSKTRECSQKREGEDWGGNVSRKKKKRKRGSLSHNRIFGKERKEGKLVRLTKPYEKKGGGEDDCKPQPVEKKGGNC